MKKILLVEDDTAIIEMLINFFSQGGHTVIVASATWQGIEILDKRHDFDIVLTDLNQGLELTGGLKVVRKAKEVSPPGTVICLMSANLDLEGAIEAAQANGVTCFIRKPFKLEALEKVLGL